MPGVPFAVDAAVLTGLVLCLIAVALRAVHGNRHVRSRLLVSAVALVGYAILASLLAGEAVPAPYQSSVRLAAPLLLAFAVVTAIVAMAINPWKHNGLPDRFPSIVQDAIVIILFAIAASAVLRERIFATTAVGAVVVGFALQDTLGNLFAGIAIQIEKPFRVGHWVRIGDTDALVNEITWRATKLRTKAGNFLIVPNSVVARDAVLNYSEPVIDTRLELEVGVSYDAPPNLVKGVILDALRDLPLLSSVKTPEVLVADFAASSVLYRIRVWTTDFGADELVRDRIRTAVYYAFRRHGVVIPYPIQVEYHKDEPPVADRSGEAAAMLTRVSIFAVLTESQRAELASTAHFGVHAAGEAVVRQGEAGASMFVVVRGEVAVSLAGVEGEVARIGAGGFFGETSLLTGDPRNATIRAIVDSELLEITAEDFRRFVLANPAAVELVVDAVARRRAELAQHAATATAAAAETPRGFAERVRRFLRIAG